MEYIPAFGGVFQQYARPEYVRELRRTYQTAAETVSRTVMTEALAAALRSSDSGVASLLASLFEHSNNEQRAKMLTILIPSLARAAQDALCHAGLFGYFPSGLEVAEERMSDLSVEAVRLIAAEAERSDPPVVERACYFYSQYPNITKYLPTETVTAVLTHLAGRGKQP